MIKVSNGTTDSDFLDAFYRAGSRGRSAYDAAGPIRQSDGDGCDASVFSGIAFCGCIVSGLNLFRHRAADCKRIDQPAAAVLLLLRKRSGILLGGIFGVTLMLWICIQFYMFPLNFMSTVYFLFGLAQAVTGYAAYVFERQETFRVRREDYPNIGTDPRRLVVFFSRMGYVKKIAYEEANRTGAAVYEIRAAERTEGTLGFWWCGRYGMHRWKMPIVPIDVDLTQYEHVTVCSPIWVFGLAAPVRSFCEPAAGRIREADYILVHYQKNPYRNVAEEMDRLLGIQHSRFRSVQCRKGKMTEIEKGLRK